MSHYVAPKVMGVADRCAATSSDRYRTRSTSARVVPVTPDGIRKSTPTTGPQNCRVPPSTVASTISAEKSQWSWLGVT
jgi:hypothetical protein